MANFEIEEGSLGVLLAASVKAVRALSLIVFVDYARSSLAKPLRWSRRIPRRHFSQIMTRGGILSFYGLFARIDG